MKSAPSIYTGSVMNVAHLPTAHANIKGDVVTDPRDEFPIIGSRRRYSQYRTQNSVGIYLTPTMEKV